VPVGEEGMMGQLGAIPASNRPDHIPRLRLTVLLVFLALVNLMTSPGHWWVQRAALGIGFAGGISLFPVLRTAVLVGGIAAQTGLRGSRQLRGRKAARVFVAVERRGRGTGRARREVIPDFKGVTLITQD
jgi:hypothetical protein